MGLRKFPAIKRQVAAWLPPHRTYHPLRMADFIGFFGCPVTIPVTEAGGMAQFRDPDGGFSARGSQGKAVQTTTSNYPGVMDEGDADGDHPLTHPYRNPIRALCTTLTIGSPCSVTSPVSTSSKSSSPS